MQLKYGLPEQISNDEIKEQFERAHEVSISAKRFNHIPSGYIAFGDLGWWLPLTRVLPLIGITPQMLRPVFTPQQKVVKRRFPFNLGWLGLNNKRYRITEVELPPTIETYEQLGYFPLSERSFQELAQILGKSVRVLRKDGETGDHYVLFTAHPSGDIT